jgi:hypothetical protein
MRSTSPAKVNHYIRTVFPQQFREVQFSMDEGTMMQVGTNAYSYHEYASYFKVSHNEYQAFKTLVRVEFEPGGNITSFHQEKVLDKRSGTTRPLIAKPAGVSKAPREVSGGKYVPCQGALGSPVGRHDAFDDVLPKTAAGFRRESVVSIICRGGFEVLAAYTAAGVEVFVAVYIGPSGFASKEELPHTFAGFKAKIEEKGVAVQPSSRSLLIVGKAGDEEKTKQLLLAMEPASLERKILAIAERLSK